MGDTRSGAYPATTKGAPPLTRTQAMMKPPCQLSYVKGLILKPTTNPINLDVLLTIFFTNNPSNESHVSVLDIPIMIIVNTANPD